MSSSPPTSYAVTVSNFGMDEDMNPVPPPPDPNGAADPADGSTTPTTPMARRGSMSEIEQKERRASIKAILADTSMPMVERRRSIQFLMDGRRNSIGSTTASMRYPAVGHQGQAQPTPTNIVSSYPYANQQDETMEVEELANARPTTHAVGGHFSSPLLVPFNRGGGDDDDDDEDATMEEAAAAATAVKSSHEIAFNDGSKRAELSRPECQHYKRNCTIISPCCGAAFGCRICHDDCPVLPPPNNLMNASTDPNMGTRRKHMRSSSMPMNLSGMQEPQHHTIDRFAIAEVICRVCFTRQSSKTNQCINCNIEFGEYHCDICNLWMTNVETPYHCSECGFCRVGGAENFEHCHDCGMCIDKKLFAVHNCKVGKYMSNCPVCQEDLFSSRSAAHEMPCGHAIHWHCFRQLAAHDSRCPVCKKTAETHERMQPTWNAMAMGIALQPIPPELAKAVDISCNDCERTDSNRSWHFLGVQCRHCTSFNTVVERIVCIGPDAYNFLQEHDPYPVGEEASQAADGAANNHGESSEH